MRVWQAETDADFAAASRLARAFQEEIFPGNTFYRSAFDKDCADMRAAYGTPNHFMLLGAIDDATPVGCFGLRVLDDSRAPGTPPIGELKRMYVMPAARGTGLARRLLNATLESARALGYHTLYLDSYHTLPNAHRLYESAGFTRCEPYNDNPPDEVLFYRLDRL